jgi:hypothetical protein
MYLLVTGFPNSVKNSSFGQALPTLATSCKAVIRLCDSVRDVIWGIFFFILAGSRLSMRFPEHIRLVSRFSRGKFSSRTNRLSLKSMASNWSRVTAKCSIAGTASPLRTSSRSPKGLGRCSARPSISADNLICTLCQLCIGCLSGKSKLQEWKGINWRCFLRSLLLLFKAWRTIALLITWTIRADIFSKSLAYLSVLFPGLHFLVVLQY